MRIYSKEFRIEAVRRVLEGEKVSTISEELGIHRKLLYDWVRRVNEGGESNLRPRGRPRKGERAGGLHGDSGPKRIAELERMVGRQQMIIEFFKNALQRIEELRQTRRATGGTASSRQSKQ
jgi:transposase-like protein